MSIHTKIFKRALTLSALFVFTAVYSFASQVTVIKQTSYTNPKLLFKGISNNNEFSNYVLNALKSCDWFDVVTSGSAKYNFSGTIAGDKATITITGEDNFSFTSQFDKTNPKWSAYKLVDTLLNKIFKIPGICASKIAFVAQHGNMKDICAANFDGTGVEQLTSNKSLSLEPSWGMNNSRIVYTLYQKNYTDIVALDVNSGRTYKLAAYPGLNNGGVISPNGKYLAVILSKDKEVALYVKEINSTRIRRITKSEGVDGCPAWSPDGKKICFVSNIRMGRPSLYISDFSSNKIYPIRILGSEAVSPSWSPDGTKIVYSAKVGNYTLAIYDIKTGTSSLVEINAGGDWFSPSWAPDNRHVVCARRLNYFYQLYIVDTFTGKAFKICSSKLNLSSPSWSGLMK